MEHLETVVKKTISKATADLVLEFLPRLVELPELKAEGVTVADVLTLWNEAHPDMTIVQSSTEAKKPRAKTDSSRKCPFVLTRGENAGKTCGKNCVVESDYCSSHTKTPATATSAASTTQSSVTLPSSVEEVKDQTTEPVAPAAGGCHHVLESGANKGKQCGKKITKDDQWCTAHGKKH